MAEVMRVDMDELSFKRMHWPLAKRTRQVGHSESTSSNYFQFNQVQDLSIVNYFEQPQALLCENWPCVRAKVTRSCCLSHFIGCCSHAISIPKGQRIHNAYMLSYVRIDEKVISVMLSSYV